MDCCNDMCMSKPSSLVLPVSILSMLGLTKLDLILPASTCLTSWILASSGKSAKLKSNSRMLVARSQVRSRCLQVATVTGELRLT